MINTHKFIYKLINSLFIYSRSPLFGTLLGVIHLSEMCQLTDCF
jgi:hypothetical protein